MSIAFEAMVFAREIHKDQKRKYTGNPYIDHLAEVAGIVATVMNQQREVSPGLMAAAMANGDELTGRSGEAAR